jgi:hypothetical protein
MGDALAEIGRLVEAWHGGLEKVAASLSLMVH